jgi:uncharacterized protein (DUF1501 family)
MLRLPVSLTGKMPTITVEFGNQNRDCRHRSRRNLLRAGVIGLGAAPGLSPVASRATEIRQGRSVVVLFLAGGASHIETFSPNAEAPEPYRSVTGVASTAVPGLQLGGTFPLLAQQAQRLVVVRSFAHGVNDHERAISHVLTGGTDPEGQFRVGYGMGAAVARLAGQSDLQSGMPRHSVLTSPHRDGQYAQELKRVVRGVRGGTLGATCDPFEQAAGASPGIRLALSPARMADREALLRRLDHARRDAEPLLPGYGAMQTQAFELLTGAASRAFDIRQERASLIERYDTSMVRVGKKVFEPSTLGGQMLLARRLVEHGANFVTVQSAGWDMHADGNNPGVLDGMRMLGPTVDKAVSAFLSDLADRGLLERTLLVITGDFGRTPKINRSGGRDHWCRLSTLALAGGSLAGGQVVGQSDPTGAEPDSEPVTPAHLFSTVIHHLFDVAALRARVDLPPEVARILEIAKPIGA